MPFPQSRFRSRTLCVLTLLAASSLSACNQGSKASEQAEFDAVKKREPARVLTEPVVRHEMVRRLETTTRVESESQVQVYPRASGVVLDVLVEEGDTVTAGQALAHLDDRDARLRLSDARAALDDARANLPKLVLASRESEARMNGSQRTAEQAERDHTRNVSISSSGSNTPALISSKDLEASQLALDRARNDYETTKLTYERAKVEQLNGDGAVKRAELTVQRAELELSYMTITAPIAGVIAERSIRAGDTFGMSTPAFVLTDPNKLRAIFYRPQRELPLFHGVSEKSSEPRDASDGGVGPQAAELEIRALAEALPGIEFTGRIERIAPTIDAASGNFRVTASLASRSDKGARLLPGMLVRLLIVTERHPDALVVPKRAIRREGDRNLLFVVRDNKAYGVEVEEGFSDDMTLEVVPKPGAKLAVGDQVIVVGNRDLEDGADVNIAPSPAAVAPAETEKH